MEATETDSADFPSPSDRIKQLNDIDKVILQRLWSKATYVLTVHLTGCHQAPACCWDRGESIDANV